ncbi:hypothetical protein JIG36_15155 [Actinoplanes sp. LDG1-06]|uniref:Anti-sigma factor n=1 Tax=Paractinoplanes ovalisporus TaxID=2810368 RepID=A0ABS2AAV3_9ACTN|nr:hypothetical protein [Actinoplanes ovalisporus]MBM2616895.1 hypothetical protein [Actinoplanes ovalisporus]
MTGAEFSGVDIDLLADYIGGALEGTPDESAVATLIARDSAWREAYEQLSGGIDVVVAELGNLPAEPMPDDLAARLDGMFAPVPQLTVVRGDAPEGGREKKRGRRMRWATPIAIAAGFIAFVGFGADYLAGQSRDDSADSASSAAGSAEKTTALADSGPGAAVTSTGTDYNRATLAAPPQVTPMSAPRSEQAFGSEEDQAQRSSSAISGDPALSRLSARAALEECFAAIQQENGGVISVQSADFARFDGAPAVIVRFSGAGGEQAWAVGPDCGARAGDADTIDKVPVR